MKKVTTLLLILLILSTPLSLCACSEETTTYTVDKGGKTYTVDSKNETLFDGIHTYKYTFSGDSSSYKIDITYPNGSTFHWTQSEFAGYGAQSDNYDEELYVSGEVLCDVIATKAPTPSNPVKFIAVIFLIGIGLFNAAVPHVAWYLSYGWRYKDAEPSDFSLGFGRIGGIIAIIVGVFMIFL